MVISEVEDAIVRRLHELPPEKQWRLLGYAEGLADSRPRGVPGKDLLRFAGMIPPDELALMAQAIEEECERVDEDGW